MPKCHFAQKLSQPFESHTIFHDFAYIAPSEDLYILHSSKMSSKPLNAAFTYILLYFLPFEYNIYIM